MSENLHYLNIPILAEHEGRDVLYLLKKIYDFSSRKIRSAKYDPAGILLDGRRVTVREIVHQGQTLSLLLNDSENKEEDLIPAEMDLDILYEDDDLIFVNKAAGIVSHPSKGHLCDSLANGLVWYFKEKGQRSYPHLIGRLDKDTSGVLGIAKNGITKERMIRMRSQGKIKKEYLALVEGHMDEAAGIIDLAMKPCRDPKPPYILTMKACRPTDPDAQAAVTHYKVIKEYNDHTLLSLNLETGRMHQIRFHLSAVGHPLLGDPLYGSGPCQNPPIASTALHAHKVTFPHPYTGKHLSITAPAPFWL